MDTHREKGLSCPAAVPQSGFRGVGVRMRGRALPPACSLALWPGSDCPTGLDTPTTHSRSAARTHALIASAPLHPAPPNPRPTLEDRRQAHIPSVCPQGWALEAGGLEDGSLPAQWLQPPPGETSKLICCAGSCTYFSEPQPWGGVRFHVLLPWALLSVLG